MFNFSNEDKRDRKKDVPKLDMFDCADPVDDCKAVLSLKDRVNDISSLNVNSRTTADVSNNKSAQNVHSVGSSVPRESFETVSVVPAGLLEAVVKNSSVRVVAGGGGKLLGDRSKVQFKIVLDPSHISKVKTSAFDDDSDDNKSDNKKKLPVKQKEQGLARMQHLHPDVIEIDAVRVEEVGKKVKAAKQSSPKQQQRSKSKSVYLNASLHLKVAMQKLSSVDSISRHRPESSEDGISQ